MGRSGEVGWRSLVTPIDRSRLRIALNRMTVDAEMRPAVIRSCLICDDHALVREALAGAVRLALPHVRISQADDFGEAWAQAASGHGMILCDLVMPGAEPYQGVDRLMSIAPEARVIVVTGARDDGMLIRLLQRGVAGFVPKAANTAVVEAALRLVIAGGRYLPERLFDIAAGDDVSASLATLPAPLPEGSAERLTERQLEVLRLVASGQSNKQIARALDLAPSTVKSHVSEIFGRLGATNRVEAFAKAQKLNLI